MSRGDGTTGELGGEQVEGIRAVLELLRARRRRVREIWISRGEGRQEGSDPVNEIVKVAESSRVSIKFVDRVALLHAASTQSPQGVVAWAAPLESCEISRLCEPSSQGDHPFLVVIDGVTDPRNLGAMARSALASGATGMVISRHRSVNVTAAAAKAGAGAFEYIPVSVVPGIPAALTRLAEEGIWTVGLVPDAQLSIYDVELWDGPVALVLGSEGKGLSRLAEKRCDLLARIPQSGPLDSLNVAAAGAVACFEVARRRSSAGA